MPQVKSNLLTTLQIKRLLPELDDRMFNDGGGLYLYLRRSGSKEWIFRYTSPITNKRRKQSLGSFPDVSLLDARNLATEKRLLLHKNIDPLLASRDEQQAEEKTDTIKVIAEQRTVSGVFYKWLDEDFKNQKYKGKETKRMFFKDVLPVIGFRAIDQVTRQDVKNVLQRPLDRAAKRVANIMLTDLKRFFNYAEDEDYIVKNPTRRLTKDRVGGKLKSRSRVLSDAELVLLFKKLPHSGLKRVYHHVIWLFIATGCRRNEIIQSSIHHFDIQQRYFTIPAERAKNTDAHKVYLSDFALYHLQAITRFTNGHWLVPDQYKDEPLDEGALGKQIRMRQPRLPLKNPNPKLRFDKMRNHNNSLELLDGHWTIHDLRRTAATLMQELGIMPHIIKKCLNQRVNDPIMETYQRAKLIEEQKHAFNLLGNHLTALTLDKTKEMKELIPMLCDA